MTTIKYGDKIKLVNQYKNPEENAGYLDSNGKLGILGGAQAFGVQTSAKPDRAGKGTATWEIVRDDLTSSGPVKYGDKIKLVNQYTDETAVPNAGYLDSYGNLGIVGGAQAFGVQTSAKPNRDGGTGTWEIVRDDLASGSRRRVEYGDNIKLVNQYTDGSAVPIAGYLESYGKDAVQTSAKPDPAGMSTTTWQVVPDGESEITVTADQDATFLSCSEGGGVNLWSHNDESGRQTWHFQKTKDEGNVYNILVSGGTNQGETYLSTYENGTVELFSHDDGSGRQKWRLVPVGAGPKGTKYNIKVFGGTDYGKSYLSCSPSGGVDLWDKDDGSGRQTWNITNFHDWGLAEPKIGIISIDWMLIGSLPAGHTTSKEITVGVIHMDSKKETNSKTFTNTFEVSSSYPFPNGATASAKASTSLALSRIVETMSSTTMTYKEIYTETWKASNKNRNIWGLTVKGVLIRYVALSTPLTHPPRAPRICRREWFHLRPPQVP